MQGTYFYIVMMEEKEEEMHFLCPAICFLDTYDGHKRAKDRTSLSL